MPDVISFSSGAYTVEVALREPPYVPSASFDHRVLREDFGLTERGTLLSVAVTPSDSEQKKLLVTQLFDPGPESGFQPGLLLIPETHLLFIGAGTRLLAYDLRTPERLWTDEADTGFWFWRRHGNLVLMSAELELAAWHVRGAKLWTTFVEPPWSYEIEGEQLTLEVMGQVRRFPAASGPSK